MSTYLRPHANLCLSDKEEGQISLSPSCSPTSFLVSSSVVAKPFTSFCLATGGGVGGREAGGVGGLLRLFCWRSRQEVM